MIDTAPTIPGVYCEATSREFQHLCPVKDEVDRGSITLTWTTTEVTLELHSLAEYLRAWRDSAITHEAMCDRIAFDLTAAGVDAATATFSGYTAGLWVTTSAGANMTGGESGQVFREPDHRGA